ncbi:MAG TPA: branched-chain amino acid ABC transporter permease [Acidimicrobiales bacterium]|nr:branched-chain amino acid ABC transporter permease [Acidimicrobiales bacterium]
MTWVDAVVQGILTGGYYALFACGLSLMFGVMGVINLAHGDLAVIAAYVAITIMPVTHLDGQLVFVVVVPLFALGGYVLQRTVLQASLDRDPFTTLLVTFGLSVVIENALLEAFSSNSQSVSIGAALFDAWNVSSQISISYFSLVIFAVAVVVLASLQLFLSRTGTGRMIRAVADDREAAQLAGANYRHIFGIAAAIALATVAVAGIASGVLSGFTPTSGTSNLLFAFEAVVIGGIGSLWGTLVGGIVLGVAQEIGAQINPAYQILAGHLVFLAVLAVRPSGLFGVRAAAA